MTTQLSPSHGSITALTEASNDTSLALPEIGASIGGSKEEASTNDKGSAETSATPPVVSTTRLAVQVLWLYLESMFQNSAYVSLIVVEKAVTRLLDCDLASAVNATPIFSASSRPLFTTLAALSNGVDVLVRLAEDFLPVLIATEVPWRVDWCRENCDKVRAVAAVLQCAVDAGVPDAAQALVEVGIDVNRLEGCTVTLLVWSMFTGQDAAVVNSVIAAKADIDWQDKDGDSVLAIAAYYPRPAAAHALIAAGACPRIRRWDGKTALTYAVSGYDAAMAKALCDAKADVDERDSLGKTLLIRATRNGDDAVFSVLVRAKAAVDSVCSERRSALLEAVSMGRADMVRVLVDARASLALRDRKGDTAVFVAVKKKHTEILRMLVAAGADVNVRDGGGMTALLTAIEAKDVGLVQTLLDAKAILYARGRDGKCPLLLAIDQGSESLVKKLLDAKANPSSFDSEGCSALLQVISKGYPGLTRLLVTARASRQCIGAKGITVPLLNVEQKTAEIVRVFVDAGASMYIRNTRGREAVVATLKAQNEAVVATLKAQNEAVVKILVDAEADIEQAYRDGHTPLRIAAEQGNVVLVKMLLGAKADPNHVNRDGNTALMAAIGADHSAVVARLKAAEASEETHDSKRAKFAQAVTASEAETKQFETRLRVEVHKMFRDIARALVNAGALIDVADGAPLLTAIERKYSDMAKVLLDGKANVEVRDLDGRTPLLLAISTGQMRVARMLLAAKADPSAVDYDWNTALLLAADKGATDIMRLLVDAGAMTGVDGRYCSVTARWLSLVEKKNVDVVQMLANARANVNVRNDKGESALLLAVRGASADMIKTLLASNANVNERDFTGETPLLTALKKDVPDLSLIRVLLAAKANPDMAGRDGVNALLTASHKGLGDMVSELAAAWVVSCVRNTYSDATLLLQAIANSDIEAVRVLVDYGVDVNVRDASGQSAVMCALLAGNMAVLQALIAAGATLDTHDQTHLSPLARAVELHNEEAVRLLVRGGASLHCSPDGKSIVQTLHAQNDVAMIGAIKDALDAYNRDEVTARREGTRADAAEATRALEPLLSRINGKHR